MIIGLPHHRFQYIDDDYPLDLWGLPDADI